ncbi:MAG TPA: DsbA family protein [Caulobacteraceae bacterium]
MSRLALLAAAAFALSACNRTPADDKVFGERVHAYLMAHPEVIQEAAEKLQQKQEADAGAALAKAAAKLPQYRAAVERDPRDFVANPGGKITVTEFYDYRCPHCANAAPKVLALIQANPDVRFVFKEMPIFGPTSEHAARAALAVKQDGGDYLGLYQAYMSTHGLDDDAIDRLALTKGAKAATLSSPSAQAQANAQMADIEHLFRDLSLGGTPAFIVGDQIIPGEDIDAVLQGINKQRAKLGG